MLIKVAVVHSADGTSGAKGFMGAEAGGWIPGGIYTDMEMWH